MKNDPEHDQLLDDVLEELAPPDFRAQMLNRTLKQVRRKSRVRRWNRGVLAVACVAALVFLVFRDRAPLVTKQQASPGTLVMINTQPLNPSQVVASTPGSVPIIATTVSTITMIETGSGRRNFRELTDDELLALVPGQPAVLVRQGPHEAELLIVDSGAGIVFPGEGTGR